MYNDKLKEQQSLASDKRKEVESRIRETLAKLLSVENIQVQHAAVPTASFDIKNRVLRIPIWKNMSESIYILLIAHEVSHALNTPLVGWEEISKTNDKTYMMVVNIIEDVRIEKLIQGRYPGTKKHFFTGYKELFEKLDIFGINDVPMEDRPLIDRINLHYKITKYGGQVIPFADEELHWLQKVDNCKTFEDVLELAKQMHTIQYQNCNNNSKVGAKKSGAMGNCDSENSDAGDQDTSDENNSDSDSGNGESKSAESNSSDSGKTDSKQAKSENKEDNKKPKSDKIGDGKAKPNTKSSGDGGVPKPSVQDLFDKLISTHVDMDPYSVPFYMNLPTEMSNDQIITPYATVHKELSQYYKKIDPEHEFIKRTFRSMEKFKHKTRPVVNHMVSLFEAKKKAKLDEKSKITKTGILNMSKMHTYRYNDDVFKKNVDVPKGKKHGLVMFFDMSGSMCQNMVGTYDQILNLVMFCKKINIPFDVYGFTDISMYHHGYKNSVDGSITFESNTSLRHYFSSQMTNKEYLNAITNVFHIRQSYIDSGRKSYNFLPGTERLGSTPLNFCVISSINLVRGMKKKYNLDIVNAIYVTDGDASDSICFNSGNGRVSNPNSGKFVVRDPETKKSWNLQMGPKMTQDLLEIVRESTGINAIGFFITSTPRDIAYRISQLEPENMLEKATVRFKERGFHKKHNARGYSTYYIILGGDNMLTDEDKGQLIEVDEDENDKNLSVGKIKRDFLKSLENRTVSRVFLSEFIEQIS